MFLELVKMGVIYGGFRVVIILWVFKFSFIFLIYVNYVNFLNLFVLCYNLYCNIWNYCWGWEVRGGGGWYFFCFLIYMYMVELFGVLLWGFLDNNKSILFKMIIVN